MGLMQANVGAGHRLLMGKSLRKPIHVGGPLLLLAAAFVMGLAWHRYSPDAPVISELRTASWGTLQHLHLENVGASEILKSEEEGGNSENNSANDTELSEEPGAVETKSQSEVRYIKQSNYATGGRFKSMRGLAKD